MLKISAQIIFLTALVLFHGCSSSGGGDSATLKRIQVTPASSEISVGTRLSFTATGVYSDNTTINLTRQVKWHSNLISIATINETGEATGIAPGATAISAELTGISGTASLSVDNAALTGIQVSPASSRIPLGKTVNFTAIGTYNDGDTHDLTAQVTWSASDKAIASIGKTGIATGDSPGSVIISAALGGWQGDASLAVENSTLMKIDVYPVTPEITVGTAIGFSAEGTYSDGTTHDLTTQVTWSASATGIANISTDGVALGVAPGNTFIRSVLGSTMGEATLNVNDAKLIEIQVLPDNPLITLGESQHFKATGKYSNNENRDLTNQVSWTVTNHPIATIEGNGKAVGLAAGSTSVIAAFSGILGSATLNSNAGDGGDFPNHAGNKFSIQFRNSTAHAIIVWLMGTQPPCSKAQADNGNCRSGNLPSNWSSDWAKMKSDFEASGTAFSIRRTNGAIVPTDISNKVTLQPGEILRIVPPIVTAADPVTGAPYTRPEWYYKHYATGVTQTAGVNAWVTKTGIQMPAAESATLIEYNIDTPNKKNIVYDLSAVDGFNSNLVMTYTGCTTERKKICKANMEAFNGTNDGCPYIMQKNSANVCPNPKFYPGTVDNRLKPSWVVGTNSFTTADVQSKYNSYWTAAGSPGGLAMAQAASGDARKKMAYHIWWSTNPVAQGWLKYLQKNKAGHCDAYGWAYDEKRWVPSDCDPQKTDKCFRTDNGNPPDNKDISALITCSYSEDSYLNIDILAVM